MRMKARKYNVPHSKEERPLNRSFNSQLIREGYSDLKTTDSDSDDGYSWEEDGDCEYTVKQSKDSVSSQRYNKLACLLAFLIFLIAALVAILIYQNVHNTDYCQDCTCTTSACVQSSFFIAQQIDSTVDPCQDFYQFACGNWDKTVTIPDTRPKYTTFSILTDNNEKIIKNLLESNSTTIKGNHSVTVERMKKYYKMCLNQEDIDLLGTTPLEQFIKDIGSWTISESGWEESSWKMEDILAKLHLHGYGPLFSIDVDVDDKNSTDYIIKIGQPDLTLSAREEYNTTYQHYTDLKTAVLDFGATVGSYLGSDYNETRKKMEDIYKLEQKLAEIFLPKEILRQPERTYHKMKVKDFQEKIKDWFDFSLFLKKFFGRDIPLTDNILVYTPEYIEKLGPIVKDTEKSVMANYFVWSAVQNLGGYLPMKFAKAALILVKVESGVEELDPLWQRCLAKANIVYGFAGSALYVDEHFPESSRTEVEDILKRIRKAFADNMPGVDWMDQQTHDKALDKLAGITPHIGYPDWIVNTHQLDKYYENVTLKDGFFNSYINHRRVEVQRSIKKLGTVPDRSEWDMFPSEVNAYYSPQYNSIVFPAGILKRPFYDPVFPMAYSFGAVGSVMGHEMTHGFDDQGRLYDKFGNLENWWTNHSTQEFLQKSECMIDQYSDFTFKGNNIIGELTQGENMADNGGVKSAYTAYSKWKSENNEKKLPGLEYTQEQLFFLGFGQLWCSYYKDEFAKTSILTDPHSPGPIRPNGIAVNSEEFAEAFKCPKGSPMNPEHKCRVW